MTTLKGDVRRLSWSPDGSYLHVQTIEREVLRDHIVTVAEKELSVAFGEPEWAAAYWAMKSDLADMYLPRLPHRVCVDSVSGAVNAAAGSG